jgi:hypothetical protein
MYMFVYLRLALNEKMEKIKNGQNDKIENVTG